MKYRDDRSNCIECYCNEPCYGHECPIEGTKCAVEAIKPRPGQSASEAPQYRYCISFYLEPRRINIKVVVS